MKIGVDIVELNPINDIDNKTVIIAEEIFNIITNSLIKK